MRLAHFSDVHVTRFALDRTSTLKCVAAWAAHLWTGRDRHFRDSDVRIAALLADIDGQRVEHALCTGDLTGISARAEFARAAELFGARLAQPGQLTVLPGNHDRYTPSSVRAGLFEEHFAGVCGGMSFPVVKTLPGGVTLVALDSARPTHLLDSSGLVGEGQRQAALAVLSDRSLRDRFVVVALHYGLLRASGRRDRLTHRLRDDVETLALLERDDVTVDVIVHGHMHTAYAVRSAKHQHVNAGSATDLHTRCGYNVYDVDAAGHRLRCERRTWNPRSGRYEADPESPLTFSTVTR